MSDDVSRVPVDGVALTAIGVAVIRARESGRPDRLYNDPLARHFVDAARAGFTAERWAQLETLADGFFEGRTVGVRLVDDRVREAVEAGIDQIVLLGAGLDTRAFRMGLPPRVAVFEIDLAELFAFKEPVLHDAGAVANCRRHVVAADLRDDWVTPLRENGFRAEEPAYWVDEGTLGFLTQEWNQRVVRTLTGLSAPGSLFGVGRFISDPDDARYRDLRALVAGEATVPATTAAPGVGAEFDTERWLNDLGWDTEFRSWNDQVAAFDRDVGVADPRIGNIAARRR
ncbi:MULTISPECIES: SAM-dependent methyltransferase [unclassified Mycobacterium]|uniref:SAM-dependent methyltransferase n=1 Tax=unclassified Mycobacterium TaxID=2642494 RepID=UPI001CDA2FB4|nr:MULTISPECIES: SAM-dependent methyltransferase [unclassified Mycobacterium]